MFDCVVNTLLTSELHLSGLKLTFLVFDIQRVEFIMKDT